MLDSLTVPRTPIHMNIARAARAVTVVLMFQLFAAVLLVISTPSWQSIVLTAILLTFTGATVWIGNQARKAATQPWNNWLLLAFTWLSLLIFSLFVSGLGIVLAITSILFTISLSAIAFGRQRSTPPMLYSVLAGTAILLVDYAIRPAMRLSLPEMQSFLYPIFVTLTTAALLLYLLQHFARFSLRQKLVISFLVLSLIPVATVRYFYDISFRQSLTDSASQNLRSVAAQTAGALDAFITTNLDSVAIQSRLPAFQRLLLTPPDDADYPNAVQAANELIYSLQNLHGSEDGEGYLIGHTLINRDGIVILDSSVPPGRFNPEIGNDYSDDSIFLNTALIGLPYASPLRVTGDMQSARIYFAHRITNAENRPIGIFMISFNAVFLQDLLEQNRNLAGPGSYGVLFDEHNIILAHAEQPELVYRSLTPLNPDVFQDLVNVGRLPNDPNAVRPINFVDLDLKLDNSTREPAFGISDITNNGSANQVATFRMDNYPWQIAFFQPEEVFLAPVNTQTIFSVLLSGFIAAVAIAVALLASNQLARPILNLTQAAEEVTAGNLNVRTSVTVQDEVGTLAIAFNSMTRQLRQTLEGLEDLVAVRTARLEATNEVGRVASSILNREDLIARIVNLITDRFGYYYAAIFLVDEVGEWAELKDATGEGGAALKKQGHRLLVSGKNMVGLAIRTYTPRIAQDVDEETVRFANPLLPETRSEIALPLMVGDHVIGALDVQSKKVRAFDQQVIETLQTLANQVAIAIENAALFERTQRAAESQQRLNEFTTSIQRATDISNILSTTVTELSSMLDTAEISIRLAPEEQLKHTGNGAEDA